MTRKQPLLHTSEGTSRSILLTIGIPVFNGMEYLGSTLDSVFENLESVDKGEVEILVSDNASTDGTAEVVSAYQERFPGAVVYHRNEENIGYDRNVDVLFRKAKGRFVHILGDDDFYQHPQCLAKILETLRKVPEARLVLLTIDLLDIPTNERITGFRVGEDIRLESGDEFFSRTLWGTAAVSSLVVQTEAWNQSKVDRFFGTQWIHVGALLLILNGQQLSYIIAEPMVVVRYRNPRWVTNGNQLELGIKHLATLATMLELGYSRETFQVFLRERFTTNLDGIRSQKPRRIQDRLRIARQMVVYFGSFPRFWLIHLPALLVPEAVQAPIRGARSFLNSLLSLPKKVAKKLLKVLHSRKG